MRTVMILRGLPGCGKSTYARELLRKESKRWARINRDDIRSMAHDNVFNSDNEEITRQFRDTLILTALKEGKDIIVDDCNLVDHMLKKMHRLFENIGDIKVIHKAFNASVDECLKRNALREGKSRVPDNVILGMAKGAGLDRGRVLKDEEFFYPKKFVEQYDQNMELPSCIISDIDGTLAIMGDRSPYDASESDTKDTINIPVAETIKLYYKAGYKIVFMSGRESKDRAATIRFIDKYLQDIPYELFMRNTGDNRKDDIVKKELFDIHVRPKYNVLFILDDRTRVITMWRSLGIPTWQVAPGDF